MRYTVRALASLRHYLPSAEETAEIEVDRQMDVQGLLEYLSIPLPEIMAIERDGHILAAGDRLSDGDLVVIYPVLSGG